MPFGMLGKFFHTFVLVENAQQGGAMRLTIQVIILSNDRNACPVPGRRHG